MWSIPLDRLVQRLRERGARTVVLQFPEGLKRKAFSTAIALKEAGFEVTISGDPCYGACDLAAGILEEGSVLVHFGHAPIEERDDVIYEPL
ncbi:MAG: diphthamide synthesis protein, partial [Methanomicrobiaceae archaeon]|nr:diphthamide synthesis protein [Methanomicrobiaceae archaeon]